MNPHIPPSSERSGTGSATGQTSHTSSTTGASGTATPDPEATGSQAFTDERFTGLPQDRAGAGGSAWYSAAAGAQPARTPPRGDTSGKTDWGAKVRHLFSSRKTAERKQIENDAQAFLGKALPGHAGQVWPMEGSGQLVQFFADGSGAAIRTPLQFEARQGGYCVRREAGRVLVERDGEAMPLHSKDAKDILTRLEDAAQSVMATDQLSLRELIDRIKAGRPVEPRLTAAALAYRLGLDNQSPRLRPERVMDTLRSADWTKKVASGELDLASLLHAIHTVSGRDEQRVLMEAIEAAIAVRRAGDPQFDSHMGKLFGVPGARPASASAADSEIQGIMRQPWIRHDLDSIQALFRNLRNSPSPNEVAASLHACFQGLGMREQIGDAALPAFIPALIDEMIAGKMIDRFNAPLAKAAAARLAQCLRLYNGAGANDAAMHAGVDMRDCTRHLFIRAIDPFSLEEVFSHPREWANLIPMDHRLQAMGEDAFKVIEADLARVVDEMAASNYLAPKLIDRLRGILPWIVQAGQRRAPEAAPPHYAFGSDKRPAGYRGNAAETGSTGNGGNAGRAGNTGHAGHTGHTGHTGHAGAAGGPGSAPVQKPPTASASGGFDAAAYVGRLRTTQRFGNAELLGLKDDINAYFRVGSQGVEGAALRQKYGPEFSAILNDSVKARKLLAHLVRLNLE